MNFQKHIFLSVLLLLMCWPGYAYSISAFPGAQGFGANSVGGRGGQVIKVTNLNDSGTGSLRAAATASGARTIVFNVSGIINLQSELEISNPYITIAGQTSPGGILVTGRPVLINTHDVIVQHIRFRIGTHGAGGNSSLLETFDTLKIYGNGNAAWFPNAAYNIIIDHCSISWGVDENVDISVGAYNLTIQWSIVSEGLSNAGHPKGEHSKGLLIDTKYAGSYVPTVSLHHNYFAHNVDRNPYICCGSPSATLDAVNNVVYNFYGALSMISESTDHVNWIHNYVKQGPGSNANAYEAINFASDPAAPSVYMEGNIGSRRLSQTSNEWSIGRMWYDELLNTGYRKTTPWPAPAVNKATMSPSVASCILSAVGATAPVRDSVDTRVINEYNSGTGSYKDTIAYPSGFPTFGTPSPPTDTDGDGIADTWEDANGLNKNVNDANLDKNGNGYTNIEDYLHYLSSKSYTFNTLCMPYFNPPASPKLLNVN